MNKDTSIVLVDDHALVRAGIRSLIGHIDGFDVIGEAGSPEALTLIRALKPQLAMIDIVGGRESELSMIERIAECAPRTRTIVFTAHSSTTLVTESLRCGAAGYLLKQGEPGELEFALRAVRADQTYLSPLLSTMIVQRFIRPAVVADGSPLDCLTPRQRQILAMIASRKSTKAIAFELQLSHKTIAAHRAQTMERTGVRDIVGLVLLAIERGLVAGQDGDPS